VGTSICSLLLIYLPRQDERLSRPGWLTYSGCFTHMRGHPSAVGQAQDGESSPVKDRRSTTQPTDKASAKPPNLSSYDLDLWPKKLTFHAIAPWTTCEYLHQNWIVFKISHSLVCNRQMDKQTYSLLWEHNASSGHYGLVEAQKKINQSINPSVSQSMNESINRSKVLVLLLVCVSWTITGQPRNSVFIRRV